MAKLKPHPSPRSGFLAQRGAAGTTFGIRLATPTRSPAKTPTSPCVTRNFSNSILKILGAKNRIRKSSHDAGNQTSRGKGATPSFPHFLAGLAFLSGVALLPLQAALVTVTNVTGEESDGDLISIERDDLVFGDGTKLALAEVRSIVLASGGGSREGTETVFLSCGSVVHCAGVALTDAEEISFQIAGGTAASFPIDAVRGVRFLPERKDSLFERNLAGKGDHDSDRVYLPQGAELRELSGLLDGLSADQVVLDRSGSMVEIPRGKVYGVLFAAALEPGLDGLNAQLRSSDGSSLRGKISGLKDGVLSLEMVEDVTLLLPLRTIESIRLRPPNLVYVSDLEPESAVAQPVLAPAREWQRDRNVLGGSLQIGRQIFEKGIGIAGGSRITFANPGVYTKLTALVGIDAGRGVRGDCEAVVLGDGQELARHRLRGGEKPLTLNVDVSSVSSIALHVEPGEDYDLSDHVNWCEAAFLKK
jgi:hypothetical protein